MRSKNNKILLAVCLISVVLSQSGPLISEFTSFGQIASEFSSFINSRVKQAANEANCLTDNYGFNTRTGNSLRTGQAKDLQLINFNFKVATPTSTTITASLENPSNAVASFKVAYTAGAEIVDISEKGTLICDLSFSQVTITRYYGASTNPYSAVHVVDAKFSKIKCTTSPANLRDQKIVSKIQTNEDFIKALIYEVSTVLRVNLNRGIIEENKTYPKVDKYTSSNKNSASIALIRQYNPVVNDNKDGIVQHYEVIVIDSDKKPIQHPSTKTVTGFTKFKVTDGSQQVSVHRNVHLLLSAVGSKNIVQVLDKTSAAKAYPTFKDLNIDVPETLYLKYPTSAELSLEVTLGQVSLSPNNTSTVIPCSGQLTVNNEGKKESVVSFKVNLTIDLTSVRGFTDKNNRIVYKFYGKDSSILASNAKIIGNTDVYSVANFSNKISRAISDYFQNNDSTLTNPIDIVPIIFGANYNTQVKNTDASRIYFIAKKSTAPKALEFLSS